MLHAKAVMLEYEANGQQLGWIGSSNFTTASERRCLELGVMIGGNKAAEMRILTTLKGLLDGWAHADGKRNTMR
jgi:phosphatidylserine/phosphatidylglycerophosphate/cardiolipin synthase-like enzyme